MDTLGKSARKAAKPHAGRHPDAVEGIKANVESSPTREMYELLWFPPGEGQVWMGQQRLLLFYPSSYQILVRAIVDGAGLAAAQAATMRVGYQAGTHAAELLRRQGNERSGAENFSEAMSVLTVAGVAKAGVVEVTADAEQGQFDAVLTWTQSLDSEFQLSHFGLSPAPACHSILGYANASASALMGAPVAFREVECQACGHETCRAVGRTVAAWGDTAASLTYLRAHELVNRFAAGQEQSTEAGPGADLVGASPGFNAAFQLLERVAPTLVDVCLLGETGVGKELFAQALHRMSPRCDGPFVAVNCAALPEGLVEAELFGVERGAFTGATRSRAGRFERAAGGTLFLDEIGTLSYSSQSKLLRVLHTREIERVGGDRVQRVDVRVVLATNEDLEAAVRAGRFREDLYFRISTFPIRIPPLRERREDIPLLTSHFLHRFCRLHGRRISGLTRAAVHALMNHFYPGNVRELEQLIERAVILAPEDQALDAPQLLFRSGGSPPSVMKLDENGHMTDGRLNQESNAAVLHLLQQRWSLREVEETLVELAIAESGGNVARAARALGMTRGQIDYRLKNGRSKVGRKKRIPSAKRTSRV